jgi:HD superfamily phosphodiesterase
MHTEPGDGIMAEIKPDEAGQAEEIQKQINQALTELDQIRNQRQTITTPEELQAAERAIIKATDKLAALLTGLKIQQAVDSDELKEKADQLVQSLPGKLKNQGKRLVSIQTSRGEPVKVAAQYFSRKKKKKKKK